MQISSAEWQAEIEIVKTQILRWLQQQEPDDPLLQAIRKVSVPDAMMLGGIMTGIIPVKFNDTIGGKNVIRYGYVVEFMFTGGARGRMHIAAIPMRKETTTKKNQVLAMALVNRAEFFKTAYSTRIHDPYSNPLFEYLLLDGDKTVAQMIVEKKNLAMLGAGLKSDTD